MVQPKVPKAVAWNRRGQENKNEFVEVTGYGGAASQTRRIQKQGLIHLKIRNKR